MVNFKNFKNFVDDCLIKNSKIHAYKVGTVILYTRFTKMFKNYC